MGWWEAPDNQNIVLGDDVLDMVRHFLQDFSQTYQNDLQRKPSLEELQYVLNLGFHVNVDDDILIDFEEREIKQVILKEAKRPKRQKPKPGDIFCFRYDELQFGFGRVVSQVFIGLVVEIFDYLSNQPIFDYSKLGKWIIEPIIINGFLLFEQRAEGDWRIIGNTPDYKPSKELESCRFIYGDGIGGNFKAMDIYGNTESITSKEAEGLPICSPSRNHQVIEMVRNALGDS